MLGVLARATERKKLEGSIFGKTRESARQLKQQFYITRVKTTSGDG